MPRAGILHAQLQRLGLAAGADSKLCVRQQREQEGTKAGGVCKQKETPEAKISVVKSAKVWGGCSTHCLLSGESCWGPLWNCQLWSTARSSVRKGEGGRSTVSAKAVKVRSRVDCSSAEQACGSCS